MQIIPKVPFRSLVLCGSSGFAEEVIAEFSRCIFAIYDPFASKDELLGIKIFRDLGQLKQYAQDFKSFSASLLDSVDDPTASYYIIGVGHPSVSKKIKAEMDAFGHFKPCPWPLISDKANITGSRNIFGKSSLIMAGVTMTENIRVGDYCIININCTVGHGAALDDFVSVMPLTAISGNVKLGNGVYVGSQAFFKEGVEVAEGTVIGAQAGIFKSINEPNLTWIGSPAKPKA